MAYNAPKSLVIQTVKNIDATLTGPTTIYTTEAGARFTPLSLIFELQSVSGFVVVCTAAIGTNSASYNNILVATALTGMALANSLLTFNLTTLLTSVAPSTAIAVNITIAATATTYVLKTTIIGAYT